MDAQDLPVLERDPWFNAIATERRSALLRDARVKAVPAGTPVYSSGDAPNGLWAVLGGQVRLKSFSENGFERLALIMRPGTWFGELSTLDGKERPHDAIAFGDAELLHISMHAFARAAFEEPGLYRDLGLLVCEHQRRALDFLAQNIGQSIRVRLARALVRTFPANGGQLRIRQEELAVIVGVARQTLNRHLRDLEEERVIEISYAQVRITDIDRLKIVGGL